MPAQSCGEREGECVGLTLAAVSGARDPWTRSTWPATPSPPRLLVGRRCGPGASSVLPKAEGERRDEARSLQPLATPTPTPRPRTLPLRGLDLGRLCPGLLGLQRLLGPPLCVRSSCGLKAGLSNSQLFLSHS